MKHYTVTVKQILLDRGFQFVKISKDEKAAYYITPNDQLVRLEDTDFILFELFGGK